MRYVPTNDPYLCERPWLLEPKEVYLAGPFFTNDQQEQNIQLAHILKDTGFSAFVPGRDCRYKVGDPAINAERAYWLNKFHIKSCNFVLADLCWPDSGTSWELGFAEALNVIKLGLVRHEKAGLNLMLRNTCDELAVVSHVRGILHSIRLDHWDRGRNLRGAIKAVGIRWEGDQQ